MNHVQVVLDLQIPTSTKLFACGKPIKIIQILDSIYKSTAPTNIPTKIEMNSLVRFEVIQISSFSERQLISRKFTAEVYKASAESHQSLPMCPEFILQ